MKKYTLLLVLSIFLFACNSNDNKSSDKVDVNKSETKGNAVADIQTVSFIVEGMTCGGCENSLKKNVLEEDGIVEVSASHLEKNAIIKFDAGKTSVEKIKNIIIDTGYEVLGQTEESEIKTDSTTTD